MKRTSTGVKSTAHTEKVLAVAAQNHVEESPTATEFADGRAKENGCGKWDVQEVQRRRQRRHAVVDVHELAFFEAPVLVARL